MGVGTSIRGVGASIMGVGASIIGVVIASRVSKANSAKQVYTNLALKEFYHCEVLKNSLLKTKHSQLKTLYH